MRIEIKFKSGKITTMDYNQETISSDELKVIMDEALFFRTFAIKI